MPKNVHRLIKFNQKAWLEPYIDINTDLRKAAKNNFEQNLFKTMNNSFFVKYSENIRKHRDIKLVATEKKGNYLVSKPNYHTAKFFANNFMTIEMKILKYS